MKKVKKIVIAEDELLIAKVLRLKLEKIGYEVENVVDGPKAIEKIIECSPDLIILDNFLKNNTNGVDVGKEIRKMGINTPIIFITGNSYEDTINQIHSIKYSMILSKPVVFEKLVQIINDYSDTDYSQP